MLINFSAYNNYDRGLFDQNVTFTVYNNIWYYAYVEGNINIKFESDEVVTNDGFVIEAYFVCDNPPPTQSISPAHTTQPYDKNTATSETEIEYTTKIYTTKSKVFHLPQIKIEIY